MTRRALLLAVAGLVLVTGVAAAVAAPALSRQVLGGGGGMVQAGAYRLNATVGQPVVGVVSGGTFGLCSGFWCGLARYEVYLPVVMRSA